VKDCVRDDPACATGDVLRILRWSSNPVWGVLVHGYGDLNAIRELDPPLKLSADDVAAGSSWTTTTGGETWTSTYLGLTHNCPDDRPDTSDTCLMFDVSTDIGSSNPIAGKWWSTWVDGVVAMELETENGRWALADLDCIGDLCDTAWW
jgi:hypothetical protein